ncbi:ABC transporter permease [Actinocorallia sp. API 0066]|uniref:ABC transporter permease n=1 Tax=Actinocorallia sp. API 0066 TaxID=2896846 RepID=UPI001E42D7D6|nr:ABC transporter permease [Actinocorallia sp. API 0066]MCD0451738.1 ABC transporter permease [Actinocorallia sp. API 0066]
MTLVETAAKATAAPSRAAFRPPPAATLVAGLALALIGVAFLWPGLIAPHSPDVADPVNALLPPGGGHLFGTDQLGRDTFSRVIYGTRPSLTIGIGATALAALAGSLLGVLALAGGRVLDEAIMRVTDVFLAFPGLLLALLVVAVLGPGTTNATLALAASATPGFVRLARAQALVVRRSDYVRAAVILGRPRAAIVLRHILPNALPPLLVLALVNVGTAIIAGSSLSFLGLGPQAPTPEWGAMLSDGRDFLSTAWHLAVFPGLAVTVTVFAINIVGRSLQVRFEGRTPGAGL